MHYNLKIIVPPFKGYKTTEARDKAVKGMVACIMKPFDETVNPESLGLEKEEYYPFYDYYTIKPWYKEQQQAIRKLKNINKDKEGCYRFIVSNWGATEAEYMYEGAHYNGVSYQKNSTTNLGDLLSRYKLEHCKIYKNAPKITNEWLVVSVDYHC